MALVYFLLFLDRNAHIEVDEVVELLVVEIFVEELEVLVVYELVIDEII